MTDDTYKAQLNAVEASMSLPTHYVEPVDLKNVDGIPRARDLDIAKRLEFDRLRDVRKLIERNLEELQRFGICATVAQNHSGGRGRPGIEYWLNEEQALLIATLSNAPRAADVREMLIRTFMAWKRGELRPALLERHDTATLREARLFFKFMFGVGKSVGFKGNQLAISANNATRKMVGVDVLNALGASALEAPDQFVLLTPTDIGQLMGGVSARTVNEFLVSSGHQVRNYDHKDRVYYEPTDKGYAAGAVMLDTGKKHSNGTPVRQLKWPSSIVETLKEEVH